MAKNHIGVNLSEQWQGGSFHCFKKFIGGKMFYLATERDISARMAMALAAKWRELKRDGRGWTPEVVEEVLAPFRPATVQPSKAARPGMLYAAIDAYLAEYQPKVSPSRYQRHVVALKTYKAQQPDCPLTSIGWDKLAATVAHFSSRPKSGHGIPMAVATVQTTITAVYALYDYLDASGQWDAPKRFARLFRVKYAALRSPLEMKRDGLGPQTFSIDELKTLWTAATPRQRLYLALGMNTGETAQGLASLMKSDLQRQGDKMVIDRNRGKTGIRGIYPLWPEVKSLVEQFMNTGENGEEGDGLLFHSGDGKPLVWYHDTGRVDSISKTWANLLKKCPKVHKIGHKYLRKTGATMIEQLTGSDRVAELYLSHAGQTVAQKHYLARDWGTLATALEKLHAHLAPVFITTATADIKAA